MPDAAPLRELGRGEPFNTWHFDRSGETAGSAARIQCLLPLRWLCCCCESAACRLCCRCPDAVERRMLLRAIRIDRSVSSTVKDLKTHMESGEGSAVKSLV